GRLHHAGRPLPLPTAVFPGGVGGVAAGHPAPPQDRGDGRWGGHRRVLHRRPGQRRVASRCARPPTGLHVRPGPGPVAGPPPPPPRPPPPPPPGGRPPPPPPQPPPPPGAPPPPPPPPPARPRRPPRPAPPGPAAPRPPP